MVALSQPLLDSGRMGLVLLDRERRIDACYGRLVNWLPPGAAATDAIPFLVGLDGILDEIAAGRLPSFTLPRVSWQETETENKILSLEILPTDKPHLLQIVLRDETVIATLEQNVVQQRNELSLANTALQQAKDRAEGALREKAAFLANISHDLKTPLQVIMGNAEILRGDLPADDRHAFLQDILDNGTFLLALITDLLEASTLEASQLDLVEEPVDMQPLLNEILTMARLMPDGCRRRFDVATEEKPVLLMADPMRLKRLLLNVVSNAVKFTGDNGCIRVNAHRTGTGDLMVEIKDNGCGIEPEMMDRVFEPFTRSGRAEGSGLGLHIARGLARLHGGELTLTSVPGVGTTATLGLPKSRLIEPPT